jgi:hypothetical protein
LILECSVIAVLLSGMSLSGEDEHDEHDADDDVHQLVTHYYSVDCPCARVGPLFATSLHNVL